MNTNELAVFTQSVNTLIEGKLILVDKHIANVLKCVATSPILCKCLGDTLRTMNYATEFSRARVTWTRTDGTTESKIKLPLDRDRLFAFVVCLLTEVDSGRRNLLDFLKEYYFDGSNDASFLKFGQEVLKPFKLAGEQILHTVDPESLNTQFTESAEKFFKAEKIYVASNVLQQVLQQNEQARQQIVKGNFNSFQRAELLTAVEYFVNALYLKNPRILRLAWLAYTNTLGKYPALNTHVQQISQLLVDVAL